jgi:CO dehydrogenase/acetyl-CoA synthase alpha subunit
LLEEKLERKFNHEMKERIIPHIRDIYNVPAMVRFAMKTTMKNSEGESINREVHTRIMEINIGISS